MWAEAEQRADRMQAGHKHMLDSNQAYGHICQETGKLPTAAIKREVKQQAAEETLQTQRAAQEQTKNALI